jgi:P-type Ca2+ transporter type 2C
VPELLEEGAITMLLTGGALTNDAVLEASEGWRATTAIGDPTEGALVIAAARVGLWKA